MNALQQVANLTKSAGELRRREELADDVAPLPAECSRRLKAMHEELADRYARSLSVLLKADVDVRLVRVEQRAFGRVIEAVHSPACFFILKSELFDDRPVLDIVPAILHPMIDRLLGGTVVDEPLPERPLTEIEMCLASRVVRAFLRECQTVWQPVLDLKLEVLEVESEPRSLRILPPDEPMILVEFDVTIAGLSGRMRFGLPCRAFDTVVEKPQTVELPPSRRPMPRTLAAVEVTLARTSVDASELTDIRVGDIIATETAADSPAVVSVEGVGEFLAKTGSYQGRKAVRLTQQMPATSSESSPSPPEC